MSALTNVTELTLENGVRFFHQRTFNENVACLHVCFGVGSLHDPPHRSGLAHFLEHLMFAGTERFGPGEYDRTIESWGGENNACTWIEWTDYRASLPREGLADLCMLELDRCMHLPLLSDAITSERGVILDERQQTVEDDPDAILEETISQLILGDAPVARPIIGSRADIEAIAIDDLARAHKRYYHAGNATVVLSGGTAADAALTCEAFTQMAAGEPTVASTLPPMSLHTQGIRKIKAPVPTARVHLAAICPGMNDVSWLHMEMLAAALTGSSAAILTQELMVDKQLASSVDAAITPSVSPAVFRIVIYGHAGVEAARITEIVTKRIEAIASGKLAEEALRAAAMRRAMGYHRELASLDGAGELIATQASLGFGLPQIERLVETEVATVAEVCEAARTWLRELLFVEVEPT